MDIEDVLNGIVDYFAASMETELQTIETARSATIPRLAYVKIVEEQVHEFPYLNILAGRTTVQYVHDEVQGTDDDAWDIHSIALQFAHSDVEPPTTQLCLLRYREAVNHLTRADKTYGARFNRVRQVSVDYSPMLQSQKMDRMLQIMTMTLSVRVLQG